MKKSNLAIGMAVLFCLAGCANREKLPVSIYDSNVETMLDVREGTTVRNVLKKAEIILDDGDTVSPSLGTVVTKGETDIVIKRCNTAQQDITEMYIEEITETKPEKQPAKQTEAPKSQPLKRGREASKNQQSKGGQEEQQNQEVSDEESNNKPEIVSKEKIYDCDGSGHGYYLIKWSDGTEEYEDF